MESLKIVTLLKNAFETLFKSSLLKNATVERRNKICLDQTNGKYKLMEAIQKFKSKKNYLTCHQSNMIMVYATIKSKHQMFQKWFIMVQENLQLFN